MIRVYLLDDHDVVRYGLKQLLERDGDIEVVGESESAVQATARIPALRPDVAILDGRLPDGSGVDVCRTEQERRILALVAEGLTNRAIAEEIHLSEKTVKNYVSSLLAKLGMHRRTEAAVLATKLLGPGPR
jgi:DNA-binding NarL/FixJ family response regulator